VLASRLLFPYPKGEKAAAVAATSSPSDPADVEQQELPLAA
jgi:hypothetical protein